MNLLEMTPSQMAGIDFDCSCGRHHRVGIEKILVGSGVLQETGVVLQNAGAKKVYLLEDVNTKAAAGEKVFSLLSALGISVHARVFPVPLVPDEACVGGALLHMEEDDDFILAVGSGTLNDTARFLSARLHIPYGIVCTAPSMDGYASTVSPMIIDRTKITLPGVFPKVIIADTALMKNAPMEMLHAGYGDVLGKFTALADWNLAKEQHGEYFCGESSALMNEALKRCTDHAAKLQERGEAAVESVTQGLLFAGIAMGLVGNSRPASGAEHHMAHFWEIALLQANLPHPLHGNCVGAAAVVSASIYEFFPELSHLAPSTSAIREFLHLAGCAVNPRELGISRELFHHSVLHAMEIRDRYTILRYGAERNRLPEIARVLTARFYD